MPEWRVHTLAEVYDFASGLSKPRSEFGSGFPFLSFKDVFYNRFVPKALDNLVQSSDAERKKCSIKRGDVFLTRTSETMDELGMSCVSLSDAPDATFNGFTKRLRPKDENYILPEYAGYFFSSPRFRQSVNAMSTMSTRASLNNDMLSRLEIVVPEPDEQLRIANVLKPLDDKIELNRRMNETLEEMARALLRDWFVDFGPTRRQMEAATDPAAIMGHAFPPEKAATLAPLFPAKLGEDGLPEGWEKRVLHDLTDWVNGAAYKNMHFSTEPDALPVIKIAELKAGVTKTTKHTNTALGDKYRIKNGEVLFSWSGNPDTSIDTFIWSGGDAWLNQHIFAVRPNGEVHQAVLYFLLKFLRPQFAEIARDKQTTGLGHVTKQDLKGMRVCLGSDDVESAATEIFSPLFAKLYANQQENQTLADMRDLLLPKLMSGEVRLHGEQV